MKSKIENRRARYDYRVLDEVEGGLALKGNEVKSIRWGMCSINGAWCRFIGNELFITGINIKPWETSNRFDVEENRDVKILLHKSELRKLKSKVSEDGIALIPLQVYENGKGKYKVRVGVCQGNKSYDKRELEKKRQVERDIARMG